MKIRYVFTILLASLCVSAWGQVPLKGKSVNVRQFYKAIRFVESGSFRNPANVLGDNGRSLGPYQISQAYWKDSRTKGRYQDVSNITYAERVMYNYWKRYVPKALASWNMEVLARVHNGGPRGYNKKETRKYWFKVRKAYLENR